MSATEPTRATGRHEEAYVGIDLAKSVEADLLADALAELGGVEVIENPSYYEVRAEHRLRLDFDELSEATGLRVDGSLIQILMSTYHGRLIYTDDAVLLIYDPTEAMEHLM